MSRYSFAFVRGVFIGCAVSTLLLVASNLVYKGVSLSLDSVYGRETDSLALAEGRSLLLYESQAGLSPVEDHVNEAEVVTRRMVPVVNDNKPAKDRDLSVEEQQLLHQQPKKALLIIVVTSGKLLKRTSDRIGRTWGRDTADYRIVVGGHISPRDASNVPNLISTSHPDFPAFPYLTIGDLNFLLNLVRNEFVDNYSWVMFLPSNAYVSVQSLQNFLGSLNANEAVYMGYPSNKSLPANSNMHYCEGGPGIVLSHTALREMKGQVEACVTSGTGGGGEDTGYLELGRCLVKTLQIDCYVGSNTSLERYFLYDRNVTSLRPEQMWKNPLFRSFLTLYPVRDQHHMDNLHTFSQAREIAGGLTGAGELESSLYLYSHCQNFPENCNLFLNASSPSNYHYHYENFSRSCNHLHRGYIPEVRRKVTNWDSVTGRTIYNSWYLDPQALVYGDLSKELKYMTSAAMDLVRKEMPDVTLHNVATLYVRYRGTTGREFIFDLELNRTTRGEVVEKRISLLLPHETQVLHHVPQVISKKELIQINFIVPLDGLDRKRVAKFQRTFYTLCVRRVENCKVVYVIFSEVTSNINFMRTYLIRFKRRHSKFNYDYIVGDGKFDMTKGYELGMASLNDEDLVLIATVDLSMADHFLTRCRTNAIRGSQIYYPEVFTYYNMPYVYRGKWHPRNYDYSRMHGRWATHAVGCIYKSDYVAINGYSTFKKWELKPVVSLDGLRVMLAPDPGVSHWYEATRCDSSLPPNQFSNCLSRQSDNLADRLSLAGYLLSLEQSCDDHKT